MIRRKTRAGQSGVARGAGLRRDGGGGFTLVELLVVIGIIAVLISVLLPSLNKARQAANAIDCQARLRQMGQALSIYVSNNKGLLPWGGVNYSGIPNTKIQFWWWMYTLSEIMDRSTVARDGSIDHLHPVFRDKDTVDPGNQPNIVNHYTCNQRLLYRADVPDDAPFYMGGQVIPANGYTQRRVSTVKRTADVLVVWDAPQWLDFQGNSYGIAEALDAWGWYNTGLVTTQTEVQTRLELAILPGQVGQSGVSDGKAAQKKYNLDSPISFGGSGWQSHLRFRHMGNTTLCALVLDGHVTTRKVGTVMRMDIFTNY